ncbi:MAG: shikimate kinase [Filimonas sp.]|nr:shikimate kinase [Filimonas sp.]
MKIFLVGMMGTGKSHWSKILSKKLKCGGYDLDHLIEMNEEKTIAEIFEQDGEDYFRKVEAKVLRWFGEKKTYVLATGGGVPCYHDNMDWMNKQGITIWIDSPIEEIVERLTPEKAHRPLIKDLSDAQLADFLRKKLADREAYYKKATYHLKEAEINEKNILKIIKEHA